MEKSENRFQSRRIMIISGGHFCHDIFGSFLAVCLPLLISKFSLTMALAGLFTVVFRAPSLLNPVLGLLADRINIFRLAIWAPAATAAGIGLLGVAQSYGVVCILLFFAGISSASDHIGMDRAFLISSFVGLLGTPFVFFLPRRDREVKS